MQGLRSLKKLYTATEHEPANMNLNKSTKTGFFAMHLRQHTKHLPLCVSPWLSIIWLRDHFHRAVNLTFCYWTFAENSYSLCFSSFDLSVLSFSLEHPETTSSILREMDTLEREATT